MGGCPGGHNHAPFILPAQHPWEEQKDHNNLYFVSVGLILMQKLFGGFSSRNLRHV